MDGSVSKEMQAEVVWDGTGSGAGSGSAAGPGRFLEQSRVLRRLSDCSRIAARGHGDARDRVSALIVLSCCHPRRAQRCLGCRAPARLGPAPRIAAAARPHSPPPRAHTHRRPRPPAPGPHSMAPGCPPLRPSVCPSGPRPGFLRRHHRRSAAGGSELRPNTAPEVMRGGEPRKPESPSVYGGGAKRHRSGLGGLLWEVHSLEAGPTGGRRHSALGEGPACGRIQERRGLGRVWLCRRGAGLPRGGA